MKVYLPSRNVAPKVISMFPVLFGLLAFLLPGVQTDSVTSTTLGAAIVALGVWTFFGKSESFIDTEKSTVSTRKHWLLFRWGSDIPLSQYKYICVIERADANSGDTAALRYYDVNLVGKYATTDHSGGFDINLPLGIFEGSPAGKEKAIELAEELSKKIGLPLNALL